MEALETRTGPFRMAVQTHPERPDGTPRQLERLFAFFVDACRGPIEPLSRSRRPCSGAAPWIAARSNRSVPVPAGTLDEPIVDRRRRLERWAIHGERDPGRLERRADPGAADRGAAADAQARGYAPTNT